MACLHVRTGVNQCNQVVTCYQCIGFSPRHLRRACGARQGKFERQSPQGLAGIVCRSHEADQGEAQQQRDFEEAQATEVLESDRVQIATQVANIKDVVGFQISDDDKNEVLASILEVNEDGDSQFMEDVFSEPEKLFKAAWLFQNAEAHFDNLEKFWKKQSSEKYKEGYNNALNGLPSSPINSGDMSGNNPVSKKAPIGHRQEKVTSMEDLHND